jgi:hypothetical protein
MSGAGKGSAAVRQGIRAVIVCVSECFCFFTKTLTFLVDSGYKRVTISTMHNRLSPLPYINALMEVCV